MSAAISHPLACAHSCCPSPEHKKLEMDPESGRFFRTQAATFPVCWPPESSHRPRPNTLSLGSQACRMASGTSSGQAALVLRTPSSMLSPGGDRAAALKGRAPSAPPPMEPPGQASALAVRCPPSGQHPLLPLGRSPPVEGCLDLLLPPDGRAAVITGHFTGSARGHRDAG